MNETSDAVNIIFKLCVCMNGKKTNYYIINATKRCLSNFNFHSPIVSNIIFLQTWGICTQWAGLHYGFAWSRYLSRPEYDNSFPGSSFNEIITYFSNFNKSIESKAKNLYTDRFIKNLRTAEYNSLEVCERWHKSRHVKLYCLCYRY